jgi:hypothetical protein
MSTSEARPRRSKDVNQPAACVGGCGPGRHRPRLGGEDRRHGPADAARLVHRFNAIPAQDERIVEASKNFPRALSAHLDGLPETTLVEIWFADVPRPLLRQRSCPPTG